MLRPLYELEEKGIITLTICAPYLEDIKCHIQKNTRMVIVTHSSNVTGEIFDVDSIESIVKNVAFFYGGCGSKCRSYTSIYGKY